MWALWWIDFAFVSWLCFVKSNWRDGFESKHLWGDGASIVKLWFEDMLEKIDKSTFNLVGVTMWFILFFFLLINHSNQRQLYGIRHRILSPYLYYELHNLLTKEMNFVWYNRNQIVHGKACLMASRIIKKSFALLTSFLEVKHESSNPSRATLQGRWWIAPCDNFV